MAKKVSIIGSGVGGLCCGIRLAHAGFDVSIFEKEAKPGGVIQYCEDPDTGIQFDQYATIGIHPGEYTELFQEVDLDPYKYFKSKVLDACYKVFAEDGRSYVLLKEYSKDPEGFEAFFGEPIGNYERFVNAFTEKYHVANRSLLTKPLWKGSQIAHPKVLQSALSLRPLRSAEHEIEKYVSSQTLRDFLLFQTFFMGLSPKTMSNVYASIPAVSQSEGLLYVQGGMGAYVSALEKAFSDLGGHLYCNRTVQNITMDGSKAIGLQLDGEFVPADFIVSDADYTFTMQNLLPQAHRAEPSDPPTMSCSVFVLRLALQTSFPMLSTHNLFLPQATKQEMDAVSDGKLPSHPPLYLYYQSHLNSAANNTCPSCINIMVRVPNRGNCQEAWDAATTQRYKEQCIETLTHITGVRHLRDSIIAQSVSTPLDLEKQFHCWQGAAFGLAPSYLQSVLFRPQLKHKGIEKLYFVGSSIHPGSGISIVMKGAKLTAQQIILDAREE